MKLKSLLAMALMVIMFTGCATAGKAPEPASSDRLAEIQALLPTAERKLKATDAWIRFTTDKALMERVQGIFQESAKALLATPEFQEYHKLDKEKTAIEKSMKPKTEGSAKK